MAIIQKSKTLNSLEFRYDDAGTVVDVIAHTTTDIGDDAKLVDDQPATIAIAQMQESVWSALTAAQKTNADALAKRIKTALGA